MALHFDSNWIIHGLKKIVVTTTTCWYWNRLRMDEILSSLAGSMRRLVWIHRKLLVSLPWFLGRHWVPLMWKLEKLGIWGSKKRPKGFVFLGIVLLFFSKGKSHPLKVRRTVVQNSKWWQFACVCVVTVRHSSHTRPYFFWSLFFSTNVWRWHVCCWWISWMKVFGGVKFRLTSGFVRKFPQTKPIVGKHPSVKCIYSLSVINMSIHGWLVVWNMFCLDFFVMTCC